MYNLVQMMYTMLLTKSPHFVVIHKKTWLPVFVIQTDTDKHAIDLIDKEFVL
jgi:hypothetical protein